MPDRPDNVVAFPPKRPRPVAAPRERDPLAQEWFTLDRDYFLAISEDEPDLEEVARLRRELRRNHRALMLSREAVEPQGDAQRESDRIAALKYQVKRSEYRIAAKPFLHTDRWWEPGYLDWDGHDWEIPEGCRNDPEPCCARCDDDDVDLSFFSFERFADPEPPRLRVVTDNQEEAP